MVSRVFVCVLIAVGLMACPAPEEPLPAGPPIAVDYEAVCDSSYHQRLVVLEGYLNLFPRLLSCYPDEAARTGRSCQVKLLPVADAPTDSVEQGRTYYTMFIDEGDQSNEARSRGYGFGSPLKVFSSDSTEIDPYDRVRLTGRFHASGRATSGDGLMCTLDVNQIDIAEPADISWADEREAERADLQARVDSMAALREERNREHPTVD